MDDGYNNSDIGEGGKDKKGRRSAKKKKKLV